MRMLFWVGGAAALAIVAACSTKRDEGAEHAPYTVEGVSQKGPFHLGSQVTIQELTASLAPNGKTYVTTTTDDFGAFHLASPITAPFLEVIVDGLFFNETAQYSQLRLTLHAIVQPAAGDVAHINVNLLTHFQSLRIAALVKSGLSFEAAEEKSRNEVLAVFAIPPVSQSFHTMNIAEGGDGNAVLLAVSMTLLRAARASGANDDALPVADYAARVRLDLEDGTMNDVGLVNQFKATQRDLGMINSGFDGGDPYGDGLRDYYAGRGVTVSIPPWRDFIDGDGNGTIDRLDKK